MQTTPLLANASAVDAANPSRAALGADDGWTAVTADGLRLAVTDDGTGPAIVCLHAVGHGASDFAALRARWRRHRRVLTLDWPGHGHSSPDRQPPTARRYARLLADVLDARGVARAVLLGNSIGGAAAIAYAASHPERVAGLILENPGGLDTPDRLARVAIGTMVRFFDAGARGARWFGPAFGLYYRLVLQRGAVAEQRRRIVATGYEMAPLLRDAWRGFAGTEADARTLVTALRCPVLFAWAARDQFVQLRRSRATIDRTPRARLERFAAGHAPHLETPAAFVASAERFLDDLGPW